MLKRKAIIPMAAVMLMSSGINSYADEKKLDKVENLNEIKYKTAEVKVAKGLNVRESNKVEDGNKLYAATKGTEFDVVGQIEEWYKVELENDEFGWINSNYVNTKDKPLYVNVSKLNFREDSNLDSKVIKVLNEGTELQIIEDKGEWIKVKYEDKEGFVYSKYITDEKVQVIETNTTKPVTKPVQNNKPQNTEKPEQVVTPEHTVKPEETVKPEQEVKPENTEKPEQAEKPSIDNSSKQSAIVNVAYAQLGKPYVWGAEGPSSFDCSGLMTYIFKNGAGVNLPRTSKQQSNFGTTVSRSNLQPGDLIFSSTDGSGGVSHVGVYVGNGEMIHAPSSGDVVKKTNINSSYWTNAYLWAKRVL